MKYLIIIALAVPVLTFVSCETTTIVKPEPTSMTTTQTRRTSSAPGYGMMPDTSAVSETRTVTSQ